MAQRHKPEASQRRPPLHCESVVFTLNVQVPLWHAKQLSLHALLQQAPSTQNPLAHSAPLLQLWPLTLVHWPPLSHIWVPLQPLGSTALVIDLQVPSPQFWQAPSQLLLQQMPLTQWVVAQSLFRLQTCPELRPQVPRPSHEYFPVHVK